MKAKNIKKELQTVQIFPDDFKYQDYHDSFKAVGYFQMIPNFLDVFRAVLIFSDDTKLSGQFQNCIKLKKIRINHG